MCGRYTLTTQLETILKRFMAKGEVASFTPRYNLSPTQMAVTVIEEGERRLVPMTWGLIPYWAKPQGKRSPVGIINARAETAAEKPSFRQALIQRRCLIPADGFFEWKKPEGGTGAKVPMRFTLKDGELFSMAGIWDRWKSPDGKEYRGFAILTTSANDLLRPVHDRMPVILHSEDEDRWLNPGLQDPAQILKMLKPFPPEEMVGYAVSPAVNSPKVDSEECVWKVET